MTIEFACFGKWPSPNIYMGEGQEEQWSFYWTAEYNTLPDLSMNHYHVAIYCIDNRLYNRVNTFCKQTKQTFKTSFCLCVVVVEWFVLLASSLPCLWCPVQVPVSSAAPVQLHAVPISPSSPPAPSLPSTPSPPTAWSTLAAAWGG